MDLKEFIEVLDSGKPVTGGSKVHDYMHVVSQEALKITMELNNRYHTPEKYGN